MALACGEDPTLCKFKQDEMRHHLFQCVREHHLRPFPHSQKNIVLTDGGMIMKTRADFPVYCTCRMPEIKDVGMVECEECLGWFHVSCETVDEEVFGISSNKL